ncbi:hypothetical protein [Prevotella aurantiaca]|uniref:hypothetical protein n=1 Tax=Prevotella aurantiaca TaxID=596085 RepID=UPI0028DBDBCF|nr:hypothetical protein [Prevotella aurantiaca]
MELEENIKRYLPQYLSEDKLTSLKKELKNFGNGYDSGKYFTNILNSAPNLFQGDCVKAQVWNLPDIKSSVEYVILLSNTCDMDISNLRLNQCRVMYAPIFNLEKYRQKLIEKKFEKNKIDNHIKDIKNQLVSQILYLPTKLILGYDSFVLFDRTISIPLTSEIVANCTETRKVSLSNYGFYLFLLKLSYHFTRIQEHVDRDAKI